MADIITGVFATRDQAEAAVRELRDRGFSASNIGIATRKIQAQARAAGAPRAPVSQPFDWVPDQQIVSLSGQNDILVAGQIAGCLHREGADQDTVTGLLTCLGVQPDHARWYDQQVRDGNTLITVLTDRPAREVELIMCQFGSISAPSRARVPSSQPPAAPSQLATSQPGSTEVRSIPAESAPPVTSAALQSAEPGWAIIGADGQQIGKVDEVGPNYLMTKKGFIFTHDVFIPLSAVAEVRPNRVKLNIPADRVSDEHWTRPPSAQTGQMSATNLPTSNRESGQPLTAAGVVAATGLVGLSDLNRVKPGFDVYTSDGQKIGTVPEASAECVHVLQCSNLFVPPNRVQQVENDRITLNVARDQMTSVDWSTCHPAHRATYAPGGAGYSGLSSQEHSGGVTIPIETIGNDQSNQP